MHRVSGLGSQVEGIVLVIWFYEELLHEGMGSHLVELELGVGELEVLDFWHLGQVDSLLKDILVEVAELVALDHVDGGVLHGQSNTSWCGSGTG